MTLGTSSFWYPYLRILPEDGDKLLAAFWDEEVIDEFQDSRFKAELEEWKIDEIITWKRFQKLLQENEKVFPKLFNNKSLFLSLWALVCSRCFAIGMVPVADTFNHNNELSSYEILHKRLHLEGHKHPAYYLFSRYLADYSAAYQDER